MKIVVISVLVCRNDSDESVYAAVVYTLLLCVIVESPNPNRHLCLSVSSNRENQR